MIRFRDLDISWKVGLHLILILALIFANIGGVWLFLQEQSQDGTAINEAGEQRMLTQRMTVSALQIGMGNDQYRTDLASSADEFDRTLTALLDGNESMGIPPAPQTVRPALLDVQNLWSPFYASVRSVLEEPRTTQEFRAALEYVETHNEQLLIESDRVVELYEREYERKVTRLQQFLVVIFGLDLLVIVLLFFYTDRHLVRPLDRLVSEALSISESNVHHSITVIDSKDEIGHLSRSVERMKTRLVDAIGELRRYEHAVEHAGHAVYITDVDGTIEYVNPTFEESTGFDSEAAIGANPRILNSGTQADSYYDDLWSTLNSGETWDEEIVNQRATGERFFAYQTIAPITDEDGEIDGFVAIMSDNTEQIVREQQNQVLSRVLRHNLRTELNLIDGYVSELLTVQDHESQATIESTLRERLDVLEKLSTTTIQFQNIFEDYDTFRQSRDLISTVERVCAAIHERYPAARVSVSVPDGALEVRGKIEYALEELLENAIQHNDRANPVVEVSVSVRETSPSMVCIEITDDGPGIPDLDRAVIEEGEESPLFHGSGLGLWLVHWTVVLMGGTVDIVDRMPRGTTVSIDVPCMDAISSSNVSSEDTTTSDDTSQLPGK